MKSAIERQPFTHRGLIARWGLSLVAVAAFATLSACTSTKSQTVASVSNAPVAELAPVDPKRRAQIRLELAAEYFQAGRFKVATEEVGQALAADPNYADAYGLLGLILMQQRDFPKADAALRKALDLKPNDGNLIHNYAWMLCQQKHFAEADQWFDKAIAQPGYEERSKSLMAKGLCYQQAGNLERAKQALLAAYEMDLNNPMIAYNLANVSWLSGDAKKAQFYIRRLNRTQSANAETLWLGIKIERAMRDDIAMRQLVQQLRERYPDSRQWHAYERSAFDE